MCNEVVKRKIIAMAILFVVFNFSANADSKIKKAEGYGTTEANARNDALSNLAFYFHTNVKSSVEGSNTMTLSKNGEKYTSKSTLEKRSLITTDFPLYGVTFEVSDNGLEGRKKQYTVVASMDPKVVLPLYELELEKSKKVIESKLRELKTLNGTKKEQAYTALAGDYAQFQKLEMIVEMLGGLENMPQLSVSPEDFNTDYATFTRQVTSLEKAAQIIADELPKNVSGIYVYAPQYEGDGAGTQFSRTVAQFIQSKLGSRTSLDRGNAVYYLQGIYYMVPGSVSADDMILSFYLCKNDGNIVASSPLIRLSYDVYGKYTYLPAGYSLTKEIANGNVADPSFGVALRINGDRNPQFFKKGDSLIVEARVTEPCYIYVLGHVFNEKGEQFSYLFPLEPYAEDKEMFVRKISSREVNKWVVLNPVIEDEVANIEIIPPYGEETLQIFAVTCADIDEAVSLIPEYRESDDYYIVRGSPSSVSTKTRGLAIKKATEKASKVVHKAESEITYTTHN